MSRWKMRLADWFDEQAEISEHLSDKKNWTPMLKHVARTFYFIGIFVGCLFGAWIVFVMKGGLR